MTLHWPVVRAFSPHSIVFLLWTASDAGTESSSRLKVLLGCIAPQVLTPRERMVANLNDLGVEH